jgi:intracellular sulfur oxidation DsrE/DsrF family protein
MRTMTSTLLMILTAALMLSAAPLAATAAGPTEGPAVQPDQRPMLMVEKNRHYRVVYDIKTDATEAGISKGLYYARGLFDAFNKQGVKPGQVDAHLVLHGGAAAMLLNDQAYQAMTRDPFATNPNRKIVQDLLNLGVSIEICHASMMAHGWTAGDILPGVTIVHDGYTRIVELQNDGYAYIGGF